MFLNLLSLNLLIIFQEHWRKQSDEEEKLESLNQKGYYKDENLEMLNN